MKRECLPFTRFTVGLEREQKGPLSTTRFTVGLGKETLSTTRFTVGLGKRLPGPRDTYLPTMVHLPSSRVYALPPCPVGVHTKGVHANTVMPGSAQYGSECGNDSFERWVTGARPPF